MKRPPVGESPRPGHMAPEGGERQPLAGGQQARNDVTAAHADASEPAAETVAPPLDMGRPPEATVPSARAARGWRRLRPRGAIGWLLYPALIFAAIAFLPQFMGWALGASQPMAAVAGNSMRPALSKGDLVLLKGVDGIDDLHVGDIIAFRNPEGLTIHRIASIEGEEIVTQGDANFVEDVPITLDHVIGKVPTVGGRYVKMPYVGHLSILLGPLIGQTSDGGSTGDELSGSEYWP